MLKHGGGSSSNTNKKAFKATKQREIAQKNSPDNISKYRSHLQPPPLPDFGIDVNELQPNSEHKKEMTSPMDDTRSLHQIITNYRIRLRLLEAEEKSHIIYQKRRNTESYRLYSSEILVCKKTLDAFMLLPSQCEYSENKNMLNTM